MNKRRIDPCHAWRWRPLALLIAVAVTGGCTSLSVKLGWRVRLQDIPVTALSAQVTDPTTHATVVALGPGQQADVVVTAVDATGKQYVTSGVGRGKVLIDSYQFLATRAVMGRGGRLTIPTDPRVTEAGPATLTIAATAHPGVSTTVSIPIRYDMAFRVDDSGANGAAGISGTNGFDGQSGADAPPAPVNPNTGVPGTQSMGGNGSAGSRGGDGSDGRDGAPGPAVHIWLRVADPATPLLQAKVEAGSKIQYFLINPAGGSLLVLANGGHGGAGGSGGRGGHGGRGGNGFPPGLSGSDGQPGSDGRRGSAGAAGTVSVTIDPAARAYEHCLTWQNQSGDGKPGAPAAVSYEPVPPLW